MVLLRFSRQGEGRRGISLMAVEPRPRGLWLRRIGWLIAIWAASIAALAVIALIFRVVMSMAGMTR
ncbi:DUF2474 family protein [Rhodanobacter denitrificans]|uniref:DUF2474 family protein n=1 Tax=Rhodanobacter denitrificans TaxID=666685 RepID=UPI003CCCC763